MTSSTLRALHQRGAPALAVILTSLLTGCTLAPAYVRPDAPVSAAYPTASGTSQAPGTAANMHATADTGWRDFFADPLLHELVAITLDNNRDLQTAWLNVEAARAQYRIQRADLLPHLDLGGEGVAQRLPSDLSPTASAGVSRQYQVGGVLASWELDLWGRVRSLDAQALSSYLALDETHAAARLSLVSEVATAYLTLRADQELERLTRGTLDAQRSAYRLSVELADAGAATRLDLRRAEIALRSAEASHAAHVRQAARDRNALVLLLGQPLSVEHARRLDAADSLDDGIVPAELPAGLPSDLLVRRPDIRAAEHTLRGANAHIGAARAAFFPTIRLTGSAGSASSTLDGLFESGSRSWSFLPRITLPIFHGGALNAGLELAQVRKRAAIAQYEKAIQTAFREVADGLAGQHTLDQQMRAQQALVHASRSAHTLAQQRFEAGVDDYLSVLDAQRTLYSGQQALVGIRLARAANRIALYKALGGGWSEGSRGESASLSGLASAHPPVAGRP